MDLLQFFIVTTLVISSTSTRRQRFRHKKFTSELKSQNENLNIAQENYHEKGIPYKFSYSVNDYNKNEHSHTAESDGDVVKGEYEVLLPDNRIQTVKYTADAISGYRAQVTYRNKVSSPSGGFGFAAGAGTQSCKQGFSGPKCAKITKVASTELDEELEEDS